MREGARESLPFKPQAGLSPENSQRQAALGSPSRPELSARPGLDQTADLTDLMQEIRASFTKGVPFAANPPAKQPPPSQGSNMGVLPSPPALSAPEISRRSSLETTGELSPSDQEEIRKIAQKPLPFGSGQSASSPTTRSTAIRTQGPAPSAPADQTITFSDLLDVSATLPFSAAPAHTQPGPQHPVPGHSRPFSSQSAVAKQNESRLTPNPDDVPTILIQGQPTAATTREHTTRQAPPNLTLEQYAELCVELEREPGRAPEVRARYGLDDEKAWATVYWNWQERLNQDPALLRRWMEATDRERRRK
jgi:hypothetical protein